MAATHQFTDNGGSTDPALNGVADAAAQVDAMKIKAFANRVLDKAIAKAKADQVNIDGAQIAIDQTARTVTFDDGDGVLTGNDGVIKYKSTDDGNGNATWVVDPTSVGSDFIGALTPDAPSFNLGGLTAELMKATGSDVSLTFDFGNGAITASNDSNASTVVYTPGSYTAPDYTSSSPAVSDYWE